MGKHLVTELLDLLIKVNQALASSYDYRLTLPEVARLVVPAVADTCVIALHDATGERVVAAYPPDGDPASGYLSVVSAPLRARKAHLGSVTFAARDAERFDAGDRRLIELLGLRIGAAVDFAAVYEREHRVADRLQRSLLPKELPSISGAGLGAAYLPATDEADIGGDWYDAFPLPDGRVAISIGDVAGHGLEAAAVMGEVRHALRAAAVGGHLPSTVLEHANSAVKLNEVTEMVTALFGYYDPVRGLLHYAVAGHPPPVFVHPDGAAAFMPHGGMPLGASPSVEAQDWLFTLPAGSRVVFYTDGMTEYDRDIELGERRLLETISQLSHDGGLTAESLQQHIFASSTNEDDAAALVLSRSEGRVRQLELVYSAIPMVGSIIRAAMRQLAAQLALDEDRTFDLTVAVGEAVANAVEHAYASKSPGTLRVSTDVSDGRLAIEVADDGRWRPIRQQTDRGRGIPLMQSLADGLQINFAQSGTRVKLLLQLGAAPEGAPSK
ncbi:MAG: SpoIIE family protein phosphatase [bacterium]|nr:SpoIIE family protein phosphatase [bacterium]